ncbi:MAG: DUF2703 domain-containing protein [Verrucomicrobiota bacterium]
MKKPPTYLPKWALSFLGLSYAAIALTGANPSDPENAVAQTAIPQNCRDCSLVGLDADARPTLKIRWKRLVVGEEEKTAPEFASAESALDRSVAALKKALTPLGVEVILQKAGVTQAEFDKDPMISNRIWINGAALTTYLPESKVGSVRDEESGNLYRTVSFAGGQFRDIPPQLIVHAGLIAAADSVKETLTDAQALEVFGTPKAGCADSSCKIDCSTPTKASGDPGTAKPGCAAGGSCKKAPASAGESAQPMPTGAAGL